MNIIAIILGIVSFMMMVLGILFLTTVLGPKRISGTVVSGTCSNSGSGYIKVKYNDTQEAICVKGDKQVGDKVTLTYPKDQKPEQGLKQGSQGDEIKIVGMNWAGILLTIFGLLGLIGSVIMFLMPQHSTTLSPNVYVNPQPSTTVSVNPKPPTVYVNPQPSSTSYPSTSYPSISYPEYSDYSSPSSPGSLNPTMNPYY
jgi:hypothetical protein